MRHLWLVVAALLVIAGVLALAPRQHTIDLCVTCGAKRTSFRWGGIPLQTSFTHDAWRQQRLTQHEIHQWGRLSQRSRSLLLGSSQTHPWAIPDCDQILNTIALQEPAHPAWAAAMLQRYQAAVANWPLDREVIKALNDDAQIEPP